MHAIVDDVFYDRAKAPVTLIFGDDGARRGRIARLVAERGGRLAGGVPIAEAGARLDAQAVAQIVVADIAADHGDILDALLARLSAGVAARRFDAVVLAPWGLIDTVAARIGGAGAELLIDPDDAAIAATLDAVMAARAAGAVAEDGDDRARLALLGEEVGRIARTLAAMAIDMTGDMPGDAGVAEPTDVAQELPFLRGEIRLRRLRERHFERALFADPAWDMLLDLRVAALEGRRVAVSSLCIAAAVPPTTALRWIATMTERGLLARVPDPQDGRRAFVTLTPRAGAAMAGYAAAALRIAAS